MSEIGTLEYWRERCHHKDKQMLEDSKTLAAKDAEIEKLKTALGVAGEFIKRNDLLKSELAEKDAVLEFYGETNVAIYDEENADSDCEQNLQYPWRYESGKRAREVMAKYNKGDE